MKFAKVLEQTLVEEEIPEEWLEAAIQYKSLKKCISKVVKELQFLGLEQNTLKVLLEDPAGDKVIEVGEAETVPTNPIIAEYTLTKSQKASDANSIVPFLKITLDYANKNYTDDHIFELGQELKRRIEYLLNTDDSENGQKVVEIKEENNVLVLSPQSTHSVPSRGGSPEPEDHQNGNRNKINEIYIMLNSDTKFFEMLSSELCNLDRLKTSEEIKLISEVERISEVVKTLSDPRIAQRKSDLYKWREVFRIYLDSEVYFRYNETSIGSSERNSEQIKKNLDEFISRIEKTGIIDTFKNKKSVYAFNQFLAMNYHLLKVLQFQSINSTAFRKILKKFDKQTSLNIGSRFPQLVTNDHIFFSGGSLAQSICYVIQTSVLTLIPQLDDYVCPICMSVAFKPIRLECNHVFCVRCLVKLKKQDKDNCPICRHEHAIAKADGGNLDLETMALIKTYFPLEVKEKMKERDKEQYEEMRGRGGQKCIIM